LDNFIAGDRKIKNGQFLSQMADFCQPKLSAHLSFVRHQHKYTSF